jgi:hypothetical protein
MFLSRDADRLPQIGSVKLELVSSRGPMPDLTSNFVPKLFQVPISSKVGSEVGTQVGPQIGMPETPY